MSTGAMPGCSVMTDTVGAVRSGNTSTGSWETANPPQARIPPAAARTSVRLASDQRISESSMRQ